MFNPSAIFAKRSIAKIKFVLFSFVILFQLTSCMNKNPLGQKGVQIYLNHVFLTVDDNVYSSIINSDFLKEKFANVRTKTTQADSNESWTGTYVSGQNTYIEIFDSGEEENRGYSGIGFGVEARGGVDSLYHLIRDSGFDQVEKSIRHLKTDTGEIPWFYYLYSTMEDSSSILSTWLMEYDPEFMNYKFKDIDPGNTDISRKLYNHESYRESLLLRDIVEFELALNRFDTDKLITELKHYGYRMKQEGESFVGKGPDIQIVIRPKTDTQSGICRIKFSLTDRLNDQKTVPFGEKSRLVLDTDGTAEWYFDI